MKRINLRASLKTKFVIASAAWRSVNNSEIIEITFPACTVVSAGRGELHNVTPFGRELPLVGSFRLLHSDESGFAITASIIRVFKDALYLLISSYKKLYRVKI